MRQRHAHQQDRLNSGNRPAGPCAALRRTSLPSSIPPVHVVPCFDTDTPQGGFRIKDSLEAIPYLLFSLCVRCRFPKYKRHRRTFAQNARTVDTRVMAPGDPLCDGQAQARTLRVDKPHTVIAIEAPEHRLQLVGRNADTAVSHLHDNGLSLASARHLHASRRRGAADGAPRLIDNRFARHVRTALGKFEGTRRTGMDAAQGRHTLMRAKIAVSAREAEHKSPGRSQTRRERNQLDDARRT